MQHQVEEIVLLPTEGGKQRRDESSIFLRSKNSPDDYTSDDQHQNVFIRYVQL